MGAVSDSYRSILQGMSQQPPAERTVGQCTLQKNLTADPIKGLSKRPPFDLKSTLYSSSSTGTKFYSYFRDNIEKYLISIEKGIISDSLKVYDLNGVEKTVHLGAGSQGYMVTGTVEPRDAYSLVTVGDKTIIANNQINIDMDIITDHTTSSNDGIVEIRGGGWGITYELFNNGTKIASYTTQTGLDAAHNPDTLSPTAIAEELKTDAATNGYTFTRYNNILLTGGSVTSVIDSKNGEYLNLIWKEVRDEKDLPDTAYHDKVVTVQPVENETAGAYYLKFIVTSVDNPVVGTLGEGYWEETVPVGTENTFDLTTMPLVLSRLPNGDFSLNIGNGTYYDGTSTITDDVIGLEWTKRLVGDDDSNPLPSFVGNAINFCGFYQGRLFFLAGENIIFSRGDAFWNFWYSTATSVLAIDPVDYSADTGQVTTLKSAVPSDGDLIIIAEDVQLLIDGTRALTPESANITPITYFKVLTSCVPEQAGRYVMIPTPQGSYSGVREFTQDKVTATRDAPPITSAVNEFIKGDIVDISVNISKGISAFVTDAYDNSIYIYESKYNSEQKIQSAWSYYALPEKYVALWSVFDKTDLYIVVLNTATGNKELWLSDIKDSDVESLDYNIYLDRRETKTNVTTSFITDEIGENFIAVQGANCPYPGLLSEIVDTTDNGDGTFTVNLKYDMGGGQVYYGEKYESKYTPTRPFVKDGNDIPIRNGYLRVNRFLVSFSNTGYIASTKVDSFRDSVTGIYSGKVVGESSAVVGQVNVGDGIIKLPFLSDAKTSYIEITSTHYTPMRIVDIEWEGTFNLNKRRL